MTISVHGRELPFTEVFTALAGGEPHMLLDDGAHFSLLEPGLQDLRRLIEEARELADSPSASLRISRYQAALWAELAALGVVTEQAQAWRRQAGALLDSMCSPRTISRWSFRRSGAPTQREGFVGGVAVGNAELGGVLADDMGLGKTMAGARADLPRRRRPPRHVRAVPRGRTDQRGGELGERGGTVRPRLTVDDDRASCRGEDAHEEVADADVVITIVHPVPVGVTPTTRWAGRC